jgi:hypothetical protein
MVEAEQASREHWVAEVEKALAYQRAVDRREGVRYTKAHRRVERRWSTMQG